MNEVLNVIRMGDETAYPLNVAECSAKGTLFFSSDFVYITSNVGFSQLEGLVGDVLVNADALIKILYSSQLGNGDLPCFLRNSSQSALIANVHEDDDKRIPQIKEIMSMMGETQKFETPQYKDAQVRCALCDTKKLS
ncbi:hypothetical protein ACOME3_000931 [Neoechinorhynchus agilis]